MSELEDKKNYRDYPNEVIEIQTETQSGKNSV